jgi:predicted DNA-binding transcriptional regulator YafY
MKINRLLEISTILLNRKSTTAKKLAERFNVSTRTIYRDIDDLSSAGVPVYTNRGKGGGIFLLEDYYISGTTLNDTDYESLKIALETLEATKYPNVETVIDKLGSTFKNKEQSTSWINIDFTPWGSDINENNKFNDIKNSILSRKVINFEYISSYGEASKRHIEPVKLWFKGRGWYIYGYCIDKKDFRLFKITRMKNILITDRTFIFRKTVSSKDKPQENQSMSLIDLTFKFKKSALYRVYDDFDSDIIKINPDGSGEVNLSLPVDEWIYGYLLSFGDGIEVLKPASLREVLKDKADKISAAYKEKL